MSNTLEQEVFGDYAAFLGKLLPQARGFLFHNRDGQVLWRDDAINADLLNAEYLQYLRQLVNAGTADNEYREMVVNGGNTFFFDLTSTQGHTLGFLAVFLEPAFSTMDWESCRHKLHAAVRSLCRELGLRVKLQEAGSNLAVQNQQYGFLRRIEQISRSQASCLDSLTDLLNVCREQFVLDGAVLHLPQHKFHVMAGRKPVSDLEAEMLFESFETGVKESGKPIVEACTERSNSDPRARTRSWPILESGDRLAGLLILSKPPTNGKWGTHTENLAGFVVSTIERILEQGFDALTGLANWSGFEASLELASSNPTIQYSVMYFDLDQLHVVNDTFGRDIGNEVLKSFGSILRECLDGHMVARVTSDSFAALVSDCDLVDGEQFGKTICEQLRQLDYTSGAKSHRPTVSIGIAALDPDASGETEVLAHAQVACQAAKDRGRDRVEIYHSADASIIRRMDDISLIGTLRSAVESGQLILFAQPIVPVSGPCDEAHFELLVRLLDETGNPIEPAKFLGTAERYQLIQDIDRWVVSKALEALAKKPTATDGKQLQYAVNLSGQSLGADQFLQFVKEQLEVYSVDPRRLCFEITETVAVSNLAKAQNFMRELKALGCKFSLDDFGTGLSSFAYLKLFEVDKLKIDGSFVHDICENEVSRAMVSAIAEIARVMKIETVAEYVQDEATLQALGAIGVNWAQGFHVGEPARLNKLISQLPKAQPLASDHDDDEYVDTVILKALPA